MFVKVFITAGFLILSWLSLVSIDTRSALHAVENASSVSNDAIAEEFSAYAAESRELISDINSRLDKIVETNNLAEENRQKENTALAESKKAISIKEAEINKIKKLVRLREAYAIVLQAELHNKTGNKDAAVAALLSSKEPIYGVSGSLPESKDALRNLMGPIDVLAGSWKNGDSAKSSDEIRKVVKSVIDANKI